MSDELIVQDERQGCTSASNAAPDKGCEGRHNAQQGLPDTTSDDAAFGQAIHDALATGDTSKLDTQQLSIYESCVEITDKLMKQVFGEDAARAVLFREKRFWCGVKATPGDTSQEPKRFKHSGKLDFVARLGPKALIIEYKTLPGDIDESPTNEQLRDQVVLSAGNLILSEVITAIAQPLVTHSPDLCLYNADAIKKAEQEMFVRVRNSNNPNAKRTAGTVQCKFCKARLTCSEHNQWAAAQLPETASVAGVPVAQWTPEQRAHFCNMRGVAQKWLDDCADEMKRLIKENPEAVPGWKLKDGQVRETVNDPQELFARFSIVAHNFAVKEAGPTDADALKLNLFMQCVSVKKGELETNVRKVTDLKGKALAAKLEELLSGIVDSKQCESSLARIKGP